MSGFTKLFSSITDSTIWQEPDATRIVWITMLAMADQRGIVNASVPGLASRARVELQACIAALERLSSPDEWSRTKDNDGRRIAEVDGGWILLNHGKYRAERSKIDRNEYQRKLMAERRAAAKLATVSRISRSEPGLAQAEAEAEAIESKEIVASPRIDGQAVEAYNRILGDALPKVTRMTSTRKSAINARVRDLAERSRVDWWEQYFEVVKSRGFLLGENDRGWRADFDWLLKPAHMQKILEGGYSGTAKKAGGYAVDGIMGRFV